MDRTGPNTPESAPVPPGSPEPPRGFHSIKVDDRGRLKLPSSFKQYLEKLGERIVFITSMDTRTIQIYPISIWKANEALLEKEQENAEEAEAIMMIANHFGGDSAIDTDGRVLLPDRLREHFGLVGRQVHLEYSRKRIQVYTEAEYKLKLEAAFGSNKDSLKVFKSKGLH